jgi:uncharacterized membrane protein
MKPDRHFRPHFQRYLFAGVLALAPLWVTWLVFNFILTQLTRAGRPWVQVLALHPWLESLLAALVTLAALYALGWATTRVLGRRLLQGFEAVLDHVPLAKAIYRVTKQVIETLQIRPQGVQRVVLIRFPHREIKTVGFVTRLIADRESGRQVAVVYVPTAPNPTSGYMELVPVEDLVSTDWTMEEAMRFVISAGTAGPELVNYGDGESGRGGGSPVASVSSP